MKFTLFAAFLFSIGWISVVVAGDGPPAPRCCLTVSNTRIPAENILKFIIQETALCPVRAVRFQTKKNKVICSDPDSDWAKNVMRKVTEGMTTKPSQKPTMCYTSTTKMIPTTAKYKETSGSETETSTSTTVPSPVTTIKISRPETSTSKTVSTTVTTIETSRLETEISKTTILPTSASTDNPESTAITCGTGETTASPTERKRITSRIGAVTSLITSTTVDNTASTATKVSSTNNKKKLSKMMIRKKGKSKKKLHKFQMGNTTG